MLDTDNSTRGSNRPSKKAKPKRRKRDKSTNLKEMILRHSLGLDLFEGRPLQGRDRTEWILSLVDSEAA